jgi:hypothetical protein
VFSLKTLTIKIKGDVNMRKLKLVKIDKNYFNSLPKRIRDAKVITVFDVESDSLAGKPFAVSFARVEINGDSITGNINAYHVCEPRECNSQWVQENVKLPDDSVLVDCLLEAGKPFFSEKDALIVGDVMFPVEARYIVQYQDKIGEWSLPYNPPITDISVFQEQKGQQDRWGQEVGIIPTDHNPNDDVLATLSILGIFMRQED